MSKGVVLASLVLSIAIASHSLAQERQQAELKTLKAMLPPSQAFDVWLEKTRYLPPDFDALPTIPYPQDLLTVMREGQSVRITAEEWPARRKELRALAEEWLVGHAPPPPGNVRAIIEQKKQETDREIWTVRLEFGPGYAAKLHCWLWIPKNLRKPAPVFLVDNLSYTRFAMDAFKAGKFAICIYNATDPVYVPEKKDESEAYNDLFGKYDWCEFYRRGWSASRAVDWLGTLDFVDRDRLFIGGHSRSAKQAMVAAAFDDRLAGVIASSPGSGGSLHFRYCDQYYYGESIERLTTVFPYWVSPKVRFFAGRENKLPADMHYIYVLLAPRPVLMSTAIHDWVENTWAVERMYESLRPVYGLLGKPGNLGIRYRVGQHSPDAATLAAHSQFLMLAAEGKSIAEAFPYRPYHPWDYEGWVRKNPMDAPPVADPTAAPRQDIRRRIEWLLGEGPGYEARRVEIGVGESEEEAKLLKRDFPALPQRTKCRFGMGINGNFYYPSKERPKEKLPGIVWLCPFQTSSGYTPSYRVGELPHIRMAKAGFVVLGFDPIGTANRQEERRTFYEQYPHWSLMGKMVLDARHAVDAMRANPDVDPNRVFLVGFGMGGMVATLTAAMDERVSGVVSVAGFTPFRTDTDAAGTGGIRRWSHLYGWIPRLGAFVGQEAKVPVDFDEILASIAPRPMLVMAPKLDWHARHEEVAKAVAAAGKTYERLGAADRLKLERPEKWIEFNDEMQGRVVEWLKGQR
ncbi:MAG: dienelactone hydrolase family protein [Bacillota bacterium]